ncbi:hypothetical protein DACRYDRAFT_24869 [Dacryopinax primogenitus]|uniref:Uncharacterized protein n=1 Tax=Dacryopinax primogenitus (strain DJM 731) TaxID=1858805 RepID=M5G2G6_DACPD|nr:uncharacterized protein DACRYDRAFT_24869 [Dacryopinax primogenitus]EJT97957.1 hypothetical protein DACRYDRAFT_24869 [Dacryopinax primogenitus]
MKSSPPKFETGKLMPRAYPRRPRRGQCEDKENTRPIISVPSQRTQSVQAEETDVFMHPRLIRPPSGQMIDSLPRSRTPFRPAAPEPPRLTSLTRRPVSPTPVRKRPASIAGYQDLVHTFHPFPASKAAPAQHVWATREDEDIRSPSQRVHQPVAEHAAAELERSLNPSNCFTSARQRPARQMSSPSVGVSDESKNIPVSEWQPAIRSASAYPQAVASPCNDPTLRNSSKQIRRGGSLALKECPILQDVSIYQADGRARRGNHTRSMDLDQLRGIWETRDRTESNDFPTKTSTRELKQSVMGTHHRSWIATPVNHVRQAKINKVDGWSLNNPEAEFVIGEWKEEEDTWEECSL